MRTLFCCFIVGGLWACSTPNSPEQRSAEPPEEAVDSRYTVLNISEESFDFDIAIPRTLAKEQEIEIEQNEAFGHLRVAAGKSFALEVTQEKGSMEQLQKQLDETLVFDYEVVEESEGAVLYRQSIPGEENDFWHVYAFMASNGDDYLLRDVSQSELNEAQSRMIFEALQRTIELNQEQGPS